MPNINHEHPEHEPENEELIPTWAALLFAVIFGIGALYMRSQRALEAFPEGGARVVGYIFGALLFPAILAAIISLIVKPWRSLKGFFITYSVICLVSIIGMLARG